MKNLNGAVESLTNKTADYFLWEKFTTKPLVDNNTFRHIGDCPSPWPCFVIAAREEFLTNETQFLKTILSIINATTAEFKDIPSIDVTIANRYEQKLKDVQHWLSLTEWSQNNLDIQTLNKVQDQLFALKIIPKKYRLTNW